MEKIIEHLGLTAEAANLIRETYEKYGDSAEFKELSAFISECKTIDEEFVEKYKKCAENIGVPAFTLGMVLLVVNAYTARDNYIKKGYGEQLFWDTVYDFKYKIDECWDKNGIWGVEPIGWFTRIFTAELFQLGRLQFEIKPLKDGGKIIGMHIPSGSPLTYDAVIDSYKRAYDFFPNTHGDLMAFTCYSYLLLPEYQKTVFKEGSNTYNFAKDFYILYSAYEEIFHDGWRIFGGDYSSDTSKLPAETSMQRAFIDYFNNGGKAGEARGVFFFDGENILKEKGIELEGLI